MKQSKVHLVPASLAKSNSQSHFYTNHFMEFLEEQSSVNHRLMDSYFQLEQSSKTLTRDIRHQNLTLNKLNNNHRYDYANIKKLLLNFIQTSNESKSQLQKQQQTLQKINEHLENHSQLNEVTNKRAENQEKALTQLQGSVNRQRNFLNNFAIKQNISLDTIKHQLDQQEERVDTQKEVIQNLLVEQQRFFTIVSESFEQQNHFDKISSMKQDQLIQRNKVKFNSLQSQIDHQEDVVNLLKEQLDNQKEILLDLSETQNNQLDLVVNQLIQQSHFQNQLNEKRELSDEMDELIQEELNLQLIQQDDIYNYLQDSLNRQQGFLLQLSDSQNRQFKKIMIQLENIKLTDTQQVKALSEIKESVQNLLYVKGNLAKLLSKLPPYYPIKQIVVAGVSINVEKLIKVNQKTGIALLSTSTQTISVDIEKIEAIHWE